MIPLIEQKKAIQKAIGVLPDGDFGPLTISALYLRLIGQSALVPIIPFAADRTIAAAMVRIAKGEVGTREVGGNNIGPKIAEYQRATWLPVGAWSWCAAFICFLVREAMAVDSDVRFDRPQTAGAWDFENWARDNEGKGVKLIKPGVGAQAGDIVVYTFSHIGLVVGLEDGGIRTVEGNTSGDGGRDGDGVYEKTRPRSLIRSLIRIEG